MNADRLARHYGLLAPEERFRLILAASGRGDETERDRLSRSAPRIALSMPDHSPYGHAFGELSHLVFIELADHAAFRRDIGEILRESSGPFCGCGREIGEKESAGKGGRPPRRPKGGWPPGCRRCLDLCGVAAFVLRVKSGGWGLFCQRMSVPPSLLWEGLPGFDRLTRDIAAAEADALTPDALLRWANLRRPAGEQEAEAVKLTPESVAEATDRMFRERVRWWGG